MLKFCQVQDADVCSGLIASEGPALKQILKDVSVGSRTNQVFCAALLGLSGYPQALPFTSNTIPPSTANVALPACSASHKPLKFIQVSDLHIDRFYVPESNYNCTKPICC